MKTTQLWWTAYWRVETILEGNIEETSFFELSIGHLELSVAEDLCPHGEITPHITVPPIEPSIYYDYLLCEFRIFKFFLQ